VYLQEDSRNNSLMVGTLDFWRILVSMEGSNNKKTMKVLGRIPMRGIIKKDVKVLG